MTEELGNKAKALNLLLNHLSPPVDVTKIISDYEDMLTLKNSNIITHSAYSVFHIRKNYHDAVLSRILEIRSSMKKKYQLENNCKPTFIVRVDDFPRWDIDTNRFLQFHKILSENKIPYLLGVIPFPAHNPLKTGFEESHEIESDDLDILKEVKNGGAEVAMHGVTHQTVNTLRHSEIVGVSTEELDKKISRGARKLLLAGFQTDFFIPPFNSFDLSSVKVLCKYFKVICGGPESVLHFGLKLSPSYLDNMLYVPSYYPAYGRAEEILPFIEKVKKIHEYVVVPLTLHWSWEVKSNFENVSKFCRAIKGQVESWNSFVSTTKID